MRVGNVCLSVGLGWWRKGGREGDGACDVNSSRTICRSEGKSESKREEEAVLLRAHLPRSLISLHTR